MLHFPKTVSLTKMDDELILLDSASGKYFGLNAVATKMVELLGEGLNEQEVVLRIGDEYQAPEDLVRKDLLELQNKLKSLGLLIQS